MSTVASVARDDLKTHLSEADYITSLQAFMQRVEDMVKLTKTPEDPGYAEYIQTVDTIALLYACLEIKQKVTTLPRPPYDPFVEAMRRRALAQVELQERGRGENKNKDSTAKSRGSAKAKTKAKRPRASVKTSLSSPTLYALSRLDEDHKKYHQPAVVDGQENEEGEGDVEMKTEDMKACAALVAEIRLYVEGLTIERWQRQSFEDALRCEGRLVGEGSSSGAKVEIGMRGDARA